MISASESKAEEKRLSLDRLRDNRARLSANAQAHDTSSMASSSSAPSPYTTPPSQSRDATISSRFFHTPSSALGNVLVPSSSPISGDSPQHRQQQTPYYFPSQGVSTTQPFVSMHSWAPTRTNTNFNDPLTATTKFVSSTKSSNASLRRPRDEADDTATIGAPPHKRVHHTPSNDVFLVPDSPLSSTVRHNGPSSHGSLIGGDAGSISSDESTVEGGTMSGASRSRLVRTRPTSSQVLQASPVSAVQDPQFTSFRLTFPGEPTPRVQAAWEHAGRDTRRATELLSNVNWSPTPAITSSKAEKEVVGRVKELEEASKAQRAAVKEKGKKSAIYANRTLDTRVPATPPSKVAASSIIMSPTTPLTPAIKLPLKKRAKKLVISDEEDEAEDSDEDERDAKRGRSETSYEDRALEYINTSGPEALQELTGCTAEQAKTLISLRPFASGDEIRKKLGQGKKRAGPSGISPRVLEDCTEMLRGYGSVDSVLEECETIGTGLKAVIQSWGMDENQLDEGEVSLVSITPAKQNSKDMLSARPKLLADDVSLKDYQLLGVNWLDLLYRRKLSCILADEMGLGKTVQVISFLALQKERGNIGPHLIVVPSSTLENWCREFKRFAPSIFVQTYYGSKDDRSNLRQMLTDERRTARRDGWEVLITTYNLAQGDEKDRKFFKRIPWECCIYDEGHVLKNLQSQRYQTLLKVESAWRLLLTGTPLQNNLQELVSLLNFILPQHFADSLSELRAIFKVKGDAKVSLLSQERISRAKKMMTPFVLRRRKDQVLKDLPKKTERIEWCEMTSLQRSIYRDALQRSRKIATEVDDDAGADGGEQKKPAKPKDKVNSDNSTNVLMDLRKAASHPMLFRRRFTDEVLAKVTKQLLKEPDFKKRKATFEFVMEDFSVMTDSEIQAYCARYKSTCRFLLDEKCFIDAGKIQVLLKLLDGYREQGRKVLIFSQFTQILDILQAVFNHKDIKFSLLTGSTPVDARQSLVDEFTEDESIPVFLLSTKAGGMGINLTAASVVIIFDQDFNPHNDRQAQDRAYRIGQKRDVEVVKLISKGTIEEDMLRLGQTKLALDEAVVGDGEDKEEGKESARERAMKTSLMKVLRQQFEKEETADNGQGA